MWEEALASMGVNSSASNPPASRSRQSQGSRQPQNSQEPSSRMQEKSCQKDRKDEEERNNLQNTQQESTSQSQSVFVPQDQQQVSEESNGSKSSRKKRKIQKTTSPNTEQLEKDKLSASVMDVQQEPNLPSGKQKKQPSQNTGSVTSHKKRKKETNKSEQSTSMEQLSAENNEPNLGENIEPNNQLNQENFEGKTKKKQSKEKKKKKKNKKKKLGMIAELLEPKETEDSSLLQTSKTGDQDIAEKSSEQQKSKSKNGFSTELNQLSPEVSQSEIFSTKDSENRPPKQSKKIHLSQNQQQNEQQQPSQEKTHESQEFSTNIWSDMLKQMGIQTEQNNSQSLSKKVVNVEKNSADVNLVGSSNLSQNRQEQKQVSGIGSTAYTSSNNSKSDEKNTSDKSRKKKLRKIEGFLRSNFGEVGDEKEEKSRQKKRKRKDDGFSTLKSGDVETSQTSKKSKNSQTAEIFQNTNKQKSKSESTSKSESKLKPSSSSGEHSATSSKNVSAEKMVKKRKKTKGRSASPSSATHNVQHAQNATQVIDLTDDSYQQSSEASHHHKEQSDTSEKKEKQKKKKKKKKKKKEKTQSISPPLDVDVTDAQHQEEEFDSSGIRQDMQPLNDIWTETLEQMGIVNQNNPRYRKNYQNRTTYQSSYPNTQQNQQNFAQNQQTKPTVDKNQGEVFVEEDINQEADQNTQNQELNNNIQQEESYFRRKKQQNLKQAKTAKSRTYKNPEDFYYKSVGPHRDTTYERWKNFFIEKLEREKKNQTQQQGSLISGVGGQSLPTSGSGQVPTNTTEQSGIKCDFISPPKRRVRVRGRRRYKRPLLYQCKDEVWWYSLRDGYIQPTQLPGTNPNELDHQKWTSYENFLVRQYANHVRSQRNRRIRSLYISGTDKLPANISDESYLREYMDFNSVGATNRAEMTTKEDYQRADVKFGGYSCHEVAVADAAFRRQLKKHRIPESKWIVAFNRSHMNLKELRVFWDEVASSLPHRPKNAVRQRLKYIYTYLGMKRGFFSAEEDDRLKKLVDQMGPDYQEIGKIMKRPDYIIKQRYLLISQQYKTGPWSEAEVAKLGKLVEDVLKRRGEQTDGGTDWEGESIYKKKVTMNEYIRRDGINWKYVSKHMGRTGASCSFKYYSSIAPSMVERGDWGRGEDRIMLYEMATSGAQAEFQVDWGNLVEGRDRQTVLRRWKLMKKAVPYSWQKPYGFILHSLIDQFCPEIMGSLTEQQQNALAEHLEETGHVQQ